MACKSQQEMMRGNWRTCTFDPSASSCYHKWRKRFEPQKSAIYFLQVDKSSMIHGGSGLHGCLGMSDDVLAIQSMCWKKPGRLHHIFHSGSFKLRVVRRITTQPFALGRFSWAWSKCWKDKSSLKRRHPCVSRALAVEKKEKHGPPIHNS